MLNCTSLFGRRCSRSSSIAIVVVVVVDYSCRSSSRSSSSRSSSRSCCCCCCCCCRRRRRHTGVIPILQYKYSEKSLFWLLPLVCFQKSAMAAVKRATIVTARPFPLGVWGWKRVAIAIIFVTSPCWAEQYPVPQQPPRWSNETVQVFFHASKYTFYSETELDTLVKGL